MDYTEFQASLDRDAPPAALDLRLRALWLDAKGEHAAAGRAIADDRSSTGDWIRAYLARRGGETAEARYRYWRAGVSPAEGSLDAERENLIRTLLVDQPVGAAYGI